ncbi:DExH-box splicing factor binding site-domain-containing protein [Xylaria palmicola]|nr:DExH-box splicing factor binding site-domain-containing protein [Xylaria palmicola]
MSGTAPPPQAPRIAIKFGTSSSAGSKLPTTATNKRDQPRPSSALGKRQRPNALHHDSDSGEDDDSIGKHEAVTFIGTDTATSSSTDLSASKRRNKECVISSLQNRDWKADVKGRRGGRTTPSRPSSLRNNDLETAPADHEKDIKWGLNVVKSTREDTSVPRNEPEQQVNSTSDTAVSPPHSPVDTEREAMDALLGNRKPAQHLIIKDSTGKSKAQFSEQDAYQRSIEEAAEVSTIEEYSEIPEGEFGAAMLRGMGWKGEELGSKPKLAKRRPHLMGLGSKEDEEIKNAELAKRHGHRERRPRLDEYRRDREKEKQERNGRYRDSYKSERERERWEQNYDHRSRDRYSGRDDRGYR